MLARLRRESEAEKTRLLQETTAAKAELEQANRRLIVSEARLRLANTAAGIGTWSSISRPASSCATSSVEACCASRRSVEV
jgi:hypothetical protein